MIPDDGDYTETWCSWICAS